MNAIVEQEPSAVALEIMPRADGAERFQPLNLRLADHIAAASAISISDEMPVEQQKAVAAQARRLRIGLFRALRIEAKNLHGEAKRGINEIGRTLDAAEREIRLACEAEEERLYDIEEFQAKREQERRQRLHEERKAALSPLLSYPVNGDLSGLTDEEFVAQLQDAKDGHERRVQKAEDERKAREEAERKAAAEEAARLEEQARLKAEAEDRRIEVERLKAEAAKAEADRAAELERLRKEQQTREAAERKAREEAEERSRQQLLALEEKTRLEREAAEREAKAKAAAEAEKAREERERLHAEKMAAEAEARKAQAELERRQAEERKAREAEEQAERARRNAPDIEKVRAFRYEVGQLELPALHPDNAAAAAAIAEQRAKFVGWLSAVIAKMEGAK